MKLTDKIGEYYYSLNNNGRSLFWLGVVGSLSFGTLAFANYQHGDSGSEYLVLMGAIWSSHTLFGYCFEEFRKSRFELFN